MRLGCAVGWRRRRRRCGTDAKWKSDFFFAGGWSRGRRALTRWGIDVSEVRSLHMAGDLGIAQPAAEGAVEAGLAREFHRRW